MTIATLKDFEIENIEEDYYTGSEFQGTWADNTCELCNVTIDISHNDKYYQLTIKPADPGAYGSYGGDWEPGLVSVEITFGNGDQYLYERYDDSVETHNLSDVIDYLFTHLDEFPTMTQRQFIEHLTDELDKRFRYIN